MAPRTVYAASAEEDVWADPRGEFRSARDAGPVYELFGLTGVGVESQPPVNTAVVLLAMLLRSRFASSPLPICAVSGDVNLKRLYDTTSANRTLSTTTLRGL